MSVVCDKSLKRAKATLAKFTRVLCPSASEADEVAAKRELSDAIHSSELSFHKDLEGDDEELNDDDGEELNDDDDGEFDDDNEQV